MSLLEEIIELGNRPPVPMTPEGDYLPDAASVYPRVQNWVVCADGFKVSVIAGAGPYCTPRMNMIPKFDNDPKMMGAIGEVPSTYPGPFSAVEVGFPSERPEPWGGDGNWAEYASDPETPTDTVYAYVPVDMVRALVWSHGDEADTQLPVNMRRVIRSTTATREAKP